jgi:hypothetical protein
MKPLLYLVCVLLTLPGSTFAAAAPSSAKVRTIVDVSTIPHRVLQRSISPRFYQSLLVSPIQGCVIVRGQLSGTRLFGMKIIHSELNGAYDSLALERANALKISGYAAVDKLNPVANVLVHLLVYQIADGTMALSFAQLDEPGGDQQEYFGSAVLQVRKSDGRWTEIKSVESLQAKGLALRKSRFALRDIYFFAGLKAR